MTPLDPPVGRLASFGFSVAFAAVLGILVGLFTTLLLGGAVAGLYVLSVLVAEGRLDRMRDRRAGEDIGTFARSFDRRAVDPYVIRAVWDEVQIHLGGRDAWVPIRASDDLVRAFGWDEDDWEDFALERAAKRSGRTLDGLTTNPLYGHVNTVGDWVHLLNGQPVVGQESGRRG